GPAGRWQRSTYVRELLVDGVRELLTGEVPFEQAVELFGQAHPPSIGVSAHMRGDDDIVEAPQRMVGRQRLLVEHVETGAGDLLAAQGRDERIGVDGVSASDV